MFLSFSTFLSHFGWHRGDALYEQMIGASSKEGDMVLDPFLGSGVSAVVARKMKRNFIGIELDDDYFYLAKERLRAA